MILKYGWWSQESWFHHVGAGDRIDDGRGNGTGNGTAGEGKMEYVFEVETYTDGVLEFVVYFEGGEGGEGGGGAVGGGGRDCIAGE